MTDKLDAERLYYVKKKNGDVCIRQSHLFSTLKTEKAVPFVDFDDNDIDEVLAPVPSYEELQVLKAQLAEVKEENTRLKEFIEEENLKDYTIMSERMDELLTKINEVRATE